VGVRVKAVYEGGAAAADDVDLFLVCGVCVLRGGGGGGQASVRTTPVNDSFNDS
jgi:hypothetical protein